MISTLTLLVVAVCMPITLAQNTNTCRACNCQFSNVQVMNQLIDERIKAAAVNEPRMFNLRAPLTRTSWLRLNRFERQFNCVYMTQRVNPAYVSALSQLKVFTHGQFVIAAYPKPV